MLAQKPQNVNKKVGSSRRKFIHVSELSDITGIAEQTIYRYIREGHIKTAQLRKGGTHLIPICIVDDLIKSVLGGK